MVDRILEIPGQNYDVSIWCGLNCVSPNSRVAATLVPGMTVFGDGAFKEVITLKRGHKVHP